MKSMNAKNSNVKNENCSTSTIYNKPKTDKSRNINIDTKNKTIPIKNKDVNKSIINEERIDQSNSIPNKKSLNQKYRGREKQHVNKEDSKSNSKCNLKTREKNLNNSKGIRIKNDNTNALIEKSYKTTRSKKNIELPLKKIKDSISFEDIEKKIFEGTLQPRASKCLSSEKQDSLNKNTKNSNSKKKNSKKNILQHKNDKDAAFNEVSTKVSKTQMKSNKQEKKPGMKNSKINKNIKTISDNADKNISNLNSESNSDSSEWEEVDELNEILGVNDTKHKASDVQIELEADNILWGIRRRKKRTHQQLVEEYFRREINKSIREVHVNMHKTHLLCLLSHGMHVNSLICADIISTHALSIIPKHYFSPKRLDMSHLEKFLSWFCKSIDSIKDDTLENSIDLSLEEILLERFKTKSSLNNKERVLMFITTARAIGMTVRYIYNLTPLTWKPLPSSLKRPIKNTEEEDIKNELPNSNSLNNQTLIVNEAKKSQKKSRKLSSSDSEVEEDNKKLKNRKRLKTKKSNDDKDFQPSLKFRKTEASKSTGKYGSKKGTSVDGSDSVKKPKKEPFQDWAEVYVEEEEKWISVDVSRNKIHCNSEIEARANNPAYIVAFNPDQTIKDVTQRYNSSWLSYNGKLRCDGDWWLKSLQPFTKRNEKDREEDKEMENNLKMQPMPSTINEYKNHPLYALQRHLLKFEGIYPPDAGPVGFIKGEPVFSREVVKTLNGRDSWLREAKTVRVDEEPYKIVKARPKWDRNTCQILKDRPLELFGEWQVEDYEPPIARNGRVPRNEYGNVDLFKPCMLPKGCVHLPVNGLSRIARKLNVDCAPVITGFEYHSGGCHPIHDGFAVCEEFADLMMDAWHQDQIEQVKKEEEKRIKRIYDNWKKLINGVTLKDRLKEKYGVSSEILDQDVPQNIANKKETQRKIKQEDLQKLPSNIFTHSVANLKIDFTTSVTDGMKNKKRSKKSVGKNKTAENISKAPSASCSKSPPHSSDSEDLSDEERRKRIRSILDWNPKSTTAATGNCSDPALSDNSDDELRLSSIDNRFKNSSLALTPISRANSSTVQTDEQNKTNPRRVLNKVKRKLNPLNEDPALSTDSENEFIEHASQAMTLSKRRSLRNRKETYYKDENGSDSDISVGDSDTGDKSYNPAQDVK